MLKTLEKSGRTEDEAIQAALMELGLDRDDVSVEILERAKSGFLGIGSSPAVVRISYEAPEEEPTPAEEPTPKAPKAAEGNERAADAAPPAEKKTFTAAKEKNAPAKAKVQEMKVENQATAPEAGRTAEFLTGLLEKMNVYATLVLTDREDGGINVNIQGPGLGSIIGRRGENLDAIQHLANYVVNKDSDRHVHISVDAENYRAKREESLVKLAQKMAAKVLKYKRSMALEPMNSYERHVIHTALQDVEGVSTCSTGTEPNRRVVISYDGPDGDRRGGYGGHRSGRPSGGRGGSRPRRESSGEHDSETESNQREKENKRPQSREWA
jgi:spoIIIJ-associated protein